MSERLTGVNEALRKEIADLKRAGKRQAAPFSKGTRATDPKRPGRRPGIGSFSYRKVSSPDEVTEPPVEVKVRLETCPKCGGRPKQERVDLAYTTDIPPVPRPNVTRYRVQVCWRTLCGRQVRGGDPDVAPDQYGASAHRVGARDGSASRSALRGGHPCEEGGFGAESPDRGEVDPEYYHSGLS